MGFGGGSGFKPGAGHAGSATYGADSGDVITVSGQLTASAGVSSTGHANFTLGAGQEFNIASSVTYKPVVIIKNTTNDTSYPELRLVKDKGSAGAQYDSPGLISFYGDDANQDNLRFASIKSYVDTHTNGSECGSLYFNVLVTGSVSPVDHSGLLIRASTGNNSKISVTIGSGSDAWNNMRGSLSLEHDGRGIYFGADSEVSLTHVHNTGLTLNKALTVTENLTVNGSAIALGNAASDVTTVTGRLTGSQGIEIPKNKLLSLGVSSGFVDPAITYTAGESDDQIDILYHTMQFKDTQMANDTPIVKWINTGASTTRGCTQRFFKSRVLGGGTTADDEDIGIFRFEGTNSATDYSSNFDEPVYCAFSASQTDITDAAECGTFTFKVMNSGTEQSILTLGGRDVANGPDYSSVTLASDTTLVGTRPSVTNLGANGSVPITGLTANVDANGSARTGIRFAGTGVAGQMLIVQNTGGENLTFHATEGTALLRGAATANDTMLPSGTYVFVSDGSLWVLIGGGAAPNALGLAAG